MSVRVRSWRRVTGSNEGQGSGTLPLRLGIIVGQSRKRIGAGGKARYTAYFDDVTGRRRSVGTFPSRRDADRAWQRAETDATAGRHTDSGRSRQLFARYVEDEWFPNHQIELTTRQNYRYVLDKHILPVFGGYKMIAILPTDIRAWVTSLSAAGVKPATIKHCLAVLSAIFTTAFNDQITSLNPTAGIKAPPVPPATRRIITPEQFDLIHAALPTPQLQLMVETDAETGLRWGELVELRVRDLDLQHGMLAVSRTVIEIPAKFHPTGGRFLIKNYPKDKQPRRLGLSAHIQDKLRNHVRGLAPTDLVFPAPPPDTNDTATADRPVDPVPVGLTEPNAAGRTYRHGTITAYNMGPCRCQDCRGAYAIYRAKRRASGADASRAASGADREFVARDRPAHLPDLVPPPDLATRPRTGRTPISRPGPRPAPRPRILATVRRRRPPSRQRPHGPRPTHHHRAIPAHTPPRRRRHHHRPGRHSQPVNLMSTFASTGSRQSIRALTAGRGVDALDRNASTITLTSLECRTMSLSRTIMSSVTHQRAASALRAVLPDRTPVREHSVDGAHRDVLVTVAGRELRLRWLPVGWPRQVAEALQHHPRPHLLAAPRLSPGARKAAAAAGVGWVDESGAAEIDLPNLVVSRTGDPADRSDANAGWRPATLAVCEALLTGCATATVSSVTDATGLAMSTAATALKFLEHDGFLAGDAARGREAGRRVSDRQALLDAYAAAASRLRAPISIPVGVLWRDPVAGAIEAGSHWTRANLDWAATSALSAAVLAPVQTEIAPMEIYVSARTPGDLRRAAATAGLQEINGGRLTLRPFPTPAGSTLTVAIAIAIDDQLRSVLWPRVYADLRTTGVRGEDAAEHLREQMAP